MLQKIKNIYKNDGLVKLFIRMFLSGKSRSRKLLFHRIPMHWHRFFSCENKLIRRIQGNLMLLDISDEGISQELVVTGVHEKNSTEQIKKELKSGMTVLEIGANIGYYALIEASCIGESGHIIAIEPSPFNMDILKVNVALNRRQAQFEYHQCAIGARRSKEKFYISNRGNLNSFIFRDDIEQDVRNIASIDVDVFSLDEFLSGRSVDYIRMDIEGYEVEAIEGMKNLLMSDRAPHGFYIEVHSSLLKERGSSGSQFLKKMQEHGYEISISYYRGSKDIVAHSMSKLLSHDLVDEGYWETFFIKK